MTHRFENIDFKRTFESLPNNEKICEIGDLYRGADLEIYQIIDKLNVGKGYNIKYGVLSAKRDNPVEKARRD